MTIHEHVVAARSRLEHAGIETCNAGIDAEALARHALGWNRAHYFSHRHNVPHLSFDSCFENLIARRERREPLAFITGTREFWSLQFDVSEAVLIPRPETEIIVRTVLDTIPDRTASLRIVDVGTGSGCLAVSLATEFPNAQILATDVSNAAIEIAKRNVAKNDLVDRIECRHTSFLAGVEKSIEVVVSNPPYIPTSHLTDLQSEIRNYEPEVALNGGVDGLEGFRALLAQSEIKLAKQGWLFFEFGFGQLNGVKALTKEYKNLELVNVVHDLQKLPRVAVLRRR
jgi:release factor glutamine methyltransferase